MNTLRQAVALRVREHVLRMAGRGGCFVGASLSCTDLLVHLYTNVLKISPETLDEGERDYLLLSKGHDVPALYGTLAELGFFPVERLATHLKPGGSIYWHPNRSIPGVEFHSGSLGHLLAVGLGIALDIRMRGQRGRVFVILGDGELNEGSIWEACLVAAAKKLDNLVAVVDRNGFQANMKTEELIPLEPLVDKFRAFGWAGREVRGHDFDDLDRAFAAFPIESGRPNVVIAHTVRGKGVPSLEGRVDRWFARFDPREVDALIEELHSGSSGAQLGEGMVVR